jgi:hypothetical protein
MPQANTIAIILGTIGILFFISIGFSIFPNKYAAFAGVACFMLAAMVRRIAAQKK